MQKVRVGMHFHITFLEEEGQVIQFNLQTRAKFTIVKIYFKQCYIFK